MEYTGDMKLLFEFTKSFITFATETGAVVDSEDRVLNILEERYGIRLVETNYNDPDCAGFIRFISKAEIVSVSRSGCNTSVATRWRKAIYVGGQVGNLWQALELLDISRAHYKINNAQ